MDPDNFHGDGDGGGFYPHHFHGGPLWLPLLMSLLALTWPLLLGLVAWTVMRVFGPHDEAPRPAPPPPNLSAMELLRLRYVEGDIDGDTFEDMVYRLLEAEQRERRLELARAMPFLRPLPQPYVPQPQPPQTVRISPSAPSAPPAPWEAPTDRLVGPNDATQPPAWRSPWNGARVPPPPPTPSPGPPPA